jgi:hypothetical protein
MAAIKRDQPKPNSGWLMGILFCTLFGTIIFAGGYRKVYVTDEEVHQRIRSEIPTGSTYPQVTDFLTRYNWGGASKLLEFENFGTLDAMLSEEEKRVVKWYSTGGIHQTQKTLFGGRGIQIGFYYDKAGKLVTYKFEIYRY